MTKKPLHYHTLIDIIIFLNFTPFPIIYFDGTIFNTSLRCFTPPNTPFIVAFVAAFHLLTILTPFIACSQQTVEFLKTFTPNHTPKAFFRAIYYCPSVKRPFTKCRLDTVTFQTGPRTFLSFYFFVIIVTNVIIIFFLFLNHPKDRHLTATRSRRLFITVR